MPATQSNPQLVTANTKVRDLDAWAEYTARGVDYLIEDQGDHTYLVTAFGKRGIVWEGYTWAAGDSRVIDLIRDARFDSAEFGAERKLAGY